MLLEQIRKRLFGKIVERAFHLPRQSIEGVPRLGGKLDASCHREIRLAPKKFGAATERERYSIVPHAARRMSIGSTEITRTVEY
jgi:hypothetical protein